MPEVAHARPGRSLATLDEHDREAPRPSLKMVREAQDPGSDYANVRLDRLALVAML